MVRGRFAVIDTDGSGTDELVEGNRTKELIM